MKEVSSAFSYLTLCTVHFGIKEKLLFSLLCIEHVSHVAPLCSHTHEPP